VLAQQLLAKNAKVVIHDPYVHATDQNLKRLRLVDHFTNDLAFAVRHAEVLIACTAHRDYANWKMVQGLSSQAKIVVDACNLWSRADFDSPVKYTGIGRGTLRPDTRLIDFVTKGFQIVEHGFARELNEIIDSLNSQYAEDEFNRVSYREVQRLAATCSTGCRLGEPRSGDYLEPLDGFLPALVDLASPQPLSAGA
jgi:hypothetical protein